MTKLFFISVLVTTNIPPYDGWIQWTNRSYQDEKMCMKSIDNSYDQIVLSVHNFLKRKLVSINSMRCMTIDAAKEKNKQLGHYK